MAFGIDHQLARSFAFDEVDVAANRAGWLSPDQQRLLEATARVGRRGARTGRAVLVLLLAVVAAAGAMAAATGSWAVAATAAGGLALPIAALVLIGRSTRRTTAAAERPVVRCATGPATVSPTMSSGTWEVVVGGVRFQVDGTDALAFRADRTYRVHHVRTVERSAIILSVEVDRA